MTVTYLMMLTYTLFANNHNYSRRKRKRSWTNSYTSLQSPLDLPMCFNSRIHHTTTTSSSSAL